jgi:hypothetical protein
VKAPGSALEPLGHGTDTTCPGLTHSLWELMLTSRWEKQTQLELPNLSKEAVSSSCRE